MKLWEQYRPTRWSDVVGQDKALAVIENIRRFGLGGRGWWISGKSGTGKTTIARLIAREIAPEYSIVEIDGGDVTAETLREISESMTGPRLYGTVYILNEAHLLRRPIISRLLTILEAVPESCALIFTTTNAGEDRLFEDFEDAGPFASRCVSLSLAQRDIIEPLAVRCREIAQAEGLDGKPLAAYKSLLREERSNMRAALSRIESGCMMA